MQGIAGILRRDGREVSEKWVQLLEGALGGVTWRFEDKVPVALGNLVVLLLSTEKGNTETTIGCEGANATWNPDLLELTLSRKGIGVDQLYTLNLGEAGDGMLFSSNPLPLLQISNMLKLTNNDVLCATQQYLQLGFVTSSTSLLYPVQSIQLEFLDIKTSCSKMRYKSNCSGSPAEDLISLIKQLGVPFSDWTLLSRLWSYRSAREQTKQLCDGLPEVSERTQKAEKLSRWQGVLSQLPRQQNAKDWSKFGITSMDVVFDSKSIERITGQNFVEPFCPIYSGTAEKQLQKYNNEIYYPDCIFRQRNAAATIAKIDLKICNGESIRLEPYPLSSWFKSPQSSLGELAGDTFTSEDAFCGLPIDREYVLKLYDDHLKEINDNQLSIFALLTLALWSELVHA